MALVGRSRARLILPMPADQTTLFARLDALGIAHVTVEHDPMFTVEQSQALREDLPGAHTKNLFLTDKDGAAGAGGRQGRHRVSISRRWRRVIGVGRLSFGKRGPARSGARRHARLGHAVRADQRSGRRGCVVVVDAALTGLRRGQLPSAARTPPPRGLPRRISSASSRPAATKPLIVALALTRAWPVAKQPCARPSLSGTSKPLHAPVRLLAAQVKALGSRVKARA